MELAGETRSDARVASEAPRATGKNGELPVGETSWSRCTVVGEPSRSFLPEGIGPTSVVRDRLIPNGSGSGDPALQG